MSSHLSSTPTPTFGATSTAEEVCHYYSPHIRNKTILITGVTPGGLGLATAKALAAHSPRLLILATRSSSALSAAKTEITSVAPGVQVKLLVLDLSSLKRVREAAAELNGWAEVDKIDILINNAGMQTQEYAKSEDGVEMHFAINHLGPWLFTNLIMAKLGAGSGRQGGEGKGGRIVWVSSMAHLYFQGGWEDVKPEVSEASLSFGVDVFQIKGRITNDQAPGK
jgi:NAD(P)-dependent dehydrogenase (short-subunit alcohol dehydrogenase family)